MTLGVDMPRDAQLDHRISIRVFPSVQEEIAGIVAEHEDKYDNESHFVRVAVMRLLREHKRGHIERGMVIE